MKLAPLVALGLIASLRTLADGLGTVTIDGETYSNITKAYAGPAGKVIILFDGGGTSANPEKVPKPFLMSWGISASNIQASAESTKAEREAAQSHASEAAKQGLQAAIDAGYFRKVSGVVYDVRQAASGWVSFPSARVIQVLDDGAILDIGVDIYSPFAIHVRHLSRTLADTDTISFIAKLSGNYSYINKNGDDRTIRDYDAGVACSRDEIPDTVLSGKKSFDVFVQSGSSTKDVVASLPDSDDLQANGTGFFITSDGYLVTNFHVVKNAHKVKVRTQSATFPADIVQTDEQDDLAILKVSGSFKPLQLATGMARLGDQVFTIGFPNIVLQGTEPKYTDGKVSSLAGIKDDPKQYQISVPVQPGNSGGPLVDSTGSVVGIIVARLDEMAALSTSGGLPQNVNYAIKVKSLTDFLGWHPEIKLSKVSSPPSDKLVETAQESVAMVLVY